MTLLLPAVSSVPRQRQPLLNVCHCCDALVLLRGLSDGCIDAVITDPPYAEIDRDYGRLTEAQWQDLMYPLVIECKRVLKPTGSAVFILQTNSKHVGSMRLWLWEFMVYCGKNWNIVQDVYWWNTGALPTTGATQYGLLKPSVKNCVWLGSPDAYRNQNEVLWKSEQEKKKNRKNNMALKYRPSGGSIREGRFYESIEKRGGTLPYNLLPIANSNSSSSAGANGHGAGTPADLIEWWMRYISKPGDTILDPFIGSGTTALTARRLNRNFIGSEKDAGYAETTRRRLKESDPYQDKRVGEWTERSMFAALSL